MGCQSICLFFNEPIALERFYLELICYGASVPADLGRTRRCAAQNTSCILALLAPRAPELGSASCASRQSTQEKTALEYRNPSRSTHEVVIFPG
jgi:hypothetical protein